MPVQYAQWVGQALRGIWAPLDPVRPAVSTLILTALTVTLPLTLLAAGLMIVAAIPSASSRHPAPPLGRLPDDEPVPARVAVPGFWAGLL